MLVGREDGGQRADLALAEAVVEAELRKPLAQTLQDRHRHDRRAVVGLAQSGQVPGREVRAARQADPDRRRGEQAVHAPRFDQVEQAVPVGRVEDQVGGADRQVGQQEDVQLRGVVQRQGVRGAVAGAEVEGGDRAQVLVDQGAVRYHRALGQGGGARGVEELHQVLGARLRAVVRGCRREAGQERVVGVAQGQRADVTGEPVREAGVGEDQGAAGLADDVREVVAGEVVVDRHVHETGAGAGQEADQVGVRVVAVGADPVAGGEALAEQDARRAGDGLVQFLVRPGTAGVLDRDPCRGAPGAAPQHPVNRAALSLRHDS